jgi:hypothetical protein
MHRIESWPSPWQQARQPVRLLPWLIGAEFNPEPSMWSRYRKRLPNQKVQATLDSAPDLQR